MRMKPRTIRRWPKRPSTAPPPAASSFAATCWRRPGRCPPTRQSVKVVVERLGSLQFDPLDVTGRNHDLVLAARIEGYARAWTDDLLYRDRWLYEAYNKGLSLLPTAELPLLPDRLGPLSGVERLREDGRPRRAGGGAARADPAGGDAVLHRRRAARLDRLVLAPDEPGARDPRGAFPLRCPRRSPAATATGGCTTSRSGSSRPSCSPSGGRRTSSAGTSSCRATAPTACSGCAAGTRRSGSAPRRRRPSGTASATS